MSAFKNVKELFANLSWKAREEGNNYSKWFLFTQLRCIYMFSHMTGFPYWLKTFEVKFSKVHDLTFSCKQVFNMTQWLHIAQEVPLLLFGITLNSKQLFLFTWKGPVTIGYSSIVPKVRWSEGSLVRRFVSPNVRLSEGSFVRRFFRPNVQ